MDFAKLLAAVPDIGDKEAREMTIARTAYGAGVAAAAPDCQRQCVQPCNGCPTPYECIDTSGCESAALRVPTYYVRHPDDTYTPADPQPAFRA